jgi:hypothetical protein
MPPGLLPYSYISKKIYKSLSPHLFSVLPSTLRATVLQTTTPTKRGQSSFLSLCLQSPLHVRLPLALLFYSQNIDSTKTWFSKKSNAKYQSTFPEAYAPKHWTASRKNITKCQTKLAKTCNKFSPKSKTNSTIKSKTISRFPISFKISYYPKS